MAFKVVPFVANIAVGDNINAAASQLSTLINQEFSGGWEYVRMENVEINIHDPGKEGCLGFGAIPPSQRTTRFDMVVFRRT